MQTSSPKSAPLLAVHIMTQEPETTKKHQAITLELKTILERWEAKIREEERNVRRGGV